MSQLTVHSGTMIETAVSTLFQNKVNSVFVGFDKKDGKGTKILGKTSGGVSSGFTFTKVGLTSDQGGADPYDNVITGQTVNVTTNLVDVSENLLDQIMPGIAYDATNEVLIGYSKLFQSEREGNEGILRLFRAIDESTWSELDEDTISFPISFPSFEEASFLSFMITEQRQLALVMMCKPSSVESFTGVTNDTIDINGETVESILFSMGTPGTDYPAIVHKKAVLTLPAALITGDEITVNINGDTVAVDYATDHDTTMAALITALTGLTGWPTGAVEVASGNVLTISDYILEATGNYGTRGIETISSSISHTVGDDTEPTIVLSFN